MVNFYKDFQFHWWQGAVMAGGFLCLGIVLETVLPNTLASLLPFVWFIGIAGTTYSLWRWWKQ